MNNVVAMRNARDWKYFDKRLTELRVNDVENIIERGRVLIEAKEELEHGSFEATVKKHFDLPTAQRLMKIARHPILANAAHAPLLPPSWCTLYELTKLDHDLLCEKIADGAINPKTERKDVMAIRDEISDRDQQTKIIEAIKADPMANQRDAAKKLGISLGLYQRTRNRLIAAGEIGKPSAKRPDEERTLPDPRRDYLSTVAKLERSAQRAEMRTLYRDFILSLSIDEQVEDLRQLVKDDMAHWKVEQFIEMMKIKQMKFRR
jgi:hypothetical protein